MQRNLRGSFQNIWRASGLQLDSSGKAELAECHMRLAGSTQRPQKGREKRAGHRLGKSPGTFRIGFNVTRRANQAPDNSRPQDFLRSSQDHELQQPRRRCVLWSLQDATSSVLDPALVVHYPSFTPPFCRPFS